MDKLLENEDDRVTGRAVVTGSATYAAEHQVPGTLYAVLTGSTIAHGTITAMDTRQAERAPGVIAVITHLNAPPVPGYEPVTARITKPEGGKGMQVFGGPYIYFNDQPIAVVVADTFERATYAASLVKATYQKEKPETDFTINIEERPAVDGPRFKDSTRGNAEAWKTAPVQVSEEYILPIEVHNPMELHSIIALWDGEDKVTVYDKTQGVISTQRSIMSAFKLKQENVQVFAPFVGGGFGSALRTWPHEIAALLAAKKTGKPVKLVLTRNQMFTMVGYRPFTKQKINLGATADGKIIGLSHEAHSITSPYEVFSEGVINISKTLYDIPNVFTRYQVHPFNVSTPTWMRGPGEATGAFALESAMDELSYKLKMDPLDLRLANHAEKDPESGKPFSSKFLKEAYQLGADAIGWRQRNPLAASMKEANMLVGYGLGGGLFNASRGTAKAIATLGANGNLVVQSAVSDSGPGTATAMVKVAANNMGMPQDKISFELGDSSLPPGPTQGGSTTTSTLGSAVHIVTSALKAKLIGLAKKSKTFSSTLANAHRPDDLVAEGGMVYLAENKSKSISFGELMKEQGLTEISAMEESKPNEKMKGYAAFSYSVHFVKVLVHPLTGMIKIDKVVIAGDAGKIISPKTAESQMIGGAVGGIGMALMEEGVLDHRYGRWINNNFADYHVPVHHDVPLIQALFVDKPDLILNPIGAKGMGEIAIIGFAAAVANAVYHATGKRLRELPLTPDKVVA
ncbi:MAG: xanthine dehydrogenase family protein molybdopterin-binding subunit [Ferruginibacter sp.]